MNSLMIPAANCFSLLNNDSLQAPMVPPAWETEFADPTLPLHVDIGCGMLAPSKIFYKFVH